MYFESLQAALQMDGHGAYVWAAYGITLIGVAWLLLSPVRARQKAIDEARALSHRLDTAEQGSADMEVSQ